MSRPHAGRIGRRQFFRRASFTLAALPVAGAVLGLLPGCDGGGATASLAPRPDSPAEPDPESLTWRTKIVSNSEPGEPLVVSGRIFARDGRTPLAGAVLYFYHTDARGIYSEQDGGGPPANPRLKGWLKTDADGRYEFRTIKPASYPNSRIPAHIHAKAKATGYAEQWVAEFWFEGDPFIGAQALEAAEAEGRFSPVMPLRRGADGVLLCARDIRLKES